MSNTFPLPPPLSDELLKKYSFFPLYIPDGGGNFITKEIFGTFDDATIVEKTLHGGVLDEFGGMESIDHHRFERWRSIEKSCWINRFYFLVPLAKKVWLTGDIALARSVVKIILNFHRKELPPVGKEALEVHWNRVAKRMEEDYNSRSFEENAKDETDVEYIWYDMQVGQRLYCLLYACYFIWENPAVTEAEKQELLECLKCHARVIADQESFQKPYPGNHQSIRAIALWWALPLLKDEPDYQEVAKYFKELCAWHILNEILPSGMLQELSPSYHAFVLWHSRDYLNIAAYRGEEIAPEVKERVAKAGQVLCCCCRSDGKALTINDSYQYDAEPLKASLGKANKAEAFSVVTPGGLASGTAGDCYAAMDASLYTGTFSHYHGGKNSVIVLYKKLPFIEEAGCPSYDRLEFPLCKRADRHTTLLVDGEGDSHQFGLYGFDGWADTHPDDAWQEAPNGCHSFHSVQTSNVPAWKGVRWERTLTVCKYGVRISDHISSTSGKHVYKLLFNLAPEVTSEQNPGGFLLENGGEQGKLSFTTSTAYSTAMGTIRNCQQSEPRDASQIQVEFAPTETLDCVTELVFATPVPSPK